MPPEGQPAPDVSLEEIERRRRHLWTTAWIALVVISLVVVVMAYWADVFPDTLADAVDFPGMRFVFLVLSLAFIVYAVGREREFRALTRRYVEIRREADSLTEDRTNRADVIATVTHELKTPLTSLLGYATILRKRGRSLSDEQREEYVEVMERQGAKILALIEELLQSTRVEAGLEKLQRVPIDLLGLCRSVASEMGTARGRTITVALPSEAPGLWGDPAAMEHVLTNLIDNALKYSEGAVSIAVIDAETEVVLTVADEGVGIKDSEISTIFDRFQQASSARGSSSVGFGLYLVKNLVEAHGGRVTVDSEVGKGSTFTVALPLRKR